jgi:hypothetical protein
LDVAFIGANREDVASERSTVGGLGSSNGGASEDIASLD